MKPIRFLVGALVALALLPATAMAQAGPGDNYLAPNFLGDEQNPLPLSPAVLGFSADTTNYTTENNASLFGGNGQEFNQCGSSIYGKTVWGVFFTNRYGRLDITASGFDSVIGLASFDSPQNPRPTGGLCSDRLFGTIESFNPDFLPTVKKNHWYAIQVGGVQDAAGNIAGGPLTVYAELLKPIALQGDAGLTWLPGKKGVKAALVRAGGTEGCEGQGHLPAQALWIEVVHVQEAASQAVLPEGEPDGQVLDEPQAAALRGSGGSGCREATNVFQGKTIPNGARLVVTVKATDQIGEMFYWDIKKNRAGAKHIRCIEPDGKQANRVGKCDGK